MFYLILGSIRIIQSIYMNKPVNISSFRLFIKNGINNLVFYFFRIIGAGQVHEVSSIFWYRFIITELLYLRNVMFQPDKLNIAVFNFSGPVPDVHDQKHYPSAYHTYITAFCKFIQKGRQVPGFNDKITRKENIYPY